MVWVSAEFIREEVLREKWFSKGYKFASYEK